MTPNATRPWPFALTTLPPPLLILLLCIAVNLLAGASQGGSPFDAGGDVNIQAGFARRGMGGAIDLTSGYSEGGSSGPVLIQSANAGDEGTSGSLDLR